MSLFHVAHARRTPPIRRRISIAWHVASWSRKKDIIVTFSARVAAAASRPTGLEYHFSLI
jgi:hypothetical protein